MCLNTQWYSNVMYIEDMICLDSQVYGLYFGICLSTLILASSFYVHRFRYSMVRIIADTATFSLFLMSSLYVIACQDIHNRDIQVYLKKIIIGGLLKSTFQSMDALMFWHRWTYVYPEKQSSLFTIGIYTFIILFIFGLNIASATIFPFFIDFNTDFGHYFDSVIIFYIQASFTVLFNSLFTVEFVRLYIHLKEERLAFVQIKPSVESCDDVSDESGVDVNNNNNNNRILDRLKIETPIERSIRIRTSVSIKSIIHCVLSSGLLFLYVYDPDIGTGIYVVVLTVCMHTFFNISNIESHTSSLIINLKENIGNQINIHLSHLHIYEQSNTSSHFNQFINHSSLNPPQVFHIHNHIVLPKYNSSLLPSSSSSTSSHNIQHHQHIHHLIPQQNEVIIPQEAIAIGHTTYRDVDSLWQMSKIPTIINE